MRKPRYSRRVTFAIGFTLFVLAMPIACTDPLSGGQGGGGSVDQFGAAGDTVYQVTQVGNVVCFEVPNCEPIYIVITATSLPTTSNTPAPMATRTPTSTPIIMPTSTIAPTWTPQPVTPTQLASPFATAITPIGNTEKCAVEPSAIRIYGWYRYTDAANLGIPQNIRVRPGTNYALVPNEKLAKNVTVTTYWLRWIGGVRWFAIEYPCGKWVSSGLGVFEYEQ